MGVKLSLRAVPEDNCHCEKRGTSDEAIPQFLEPTMPREHHYFVSIMTNQRNTVLYVGVTNSLVRRGYQHKEKLSHHESFTKKYNINKLVFYEEYSNILGAIAREKQLKGGSRQKKIDLVNTVNPEWKDLYEGVFL